MMVGRASSAFLVGYRTRFGRCSSSAGLILSGLDGSSLDSSIRFRLWVSAGGSAAANSISAINMSCLLRSLPSRAVNCMLERSTPETSLLEWRGPFEATAVDRGKYIAAMCYLVELAMAML